MAYASDFTWNDDGTVSVGDIAYKPKKITGAKLAAVLSEDPFLSPFGVWCELTRAAPKPYIETPHLIAGRVLEPQLAEFVEKRSRFSLVRPEDIWGWDFKNIKNYDFFPENEVFGGMWDALLTRGRELWGIVEFKTSSHRKIWHQGIPKQYERQAQLYAWLSKTPYYHFAVSFLEAKDVENPKGFRCDEDNTLLFHEKMPDDFADVIGQASSWYAKHVANGAASPPYDEERDAEYIALLEARKPRC